MRILFVSGVATGGARQSTLELAELLATRGHTIYTLLTKRPSERSVYGLLTRVHLKLARVAALRRFTGWLMRLLGRSSKVLSSTPSNTVFTASVAENAYRRLLREHRPDVVVVNSVPRLALQTMVRDLEGHVPLVLYMREAHAITHLTISGLNPDRIVANSRELCEQVEAAGLEARFVPSIINLDSAAMCTTRQTVVMINPIRENRPELFCKMAQSYPHVKFVLQESWPLDTSARAMLFERINEFPNIEFRTRVESPAEVYRDARLLVATYPAGRPRVVVEAQFNGIPVVALNQPALAEITGPMDTLVDRDASDEAWVAAVKRYLDDDSFYDEACVSAREWARRPSIAPDQTAADFEDALAGLHAGGHDVA